MHRRLLNALAWSGIVFLAACQPASETTEEAASATPEASAAAEPVPAAPQPLTGEPGLWALSDEDTTVHLFGTVHILKPDLQWQTDEFQAVFDDADAIYFEADVSPEATQSLAPILGQLATFNDGRTLADVLDEDELREVQEAAELVGLPMVSVNVLRPWFASLSLTEQHLIRSGYESGSGVEMVLMGEAQTESKEMRFLETAEFQLRLLAGLSDEEAEKMLVQTAIEIEENPDALDDLVNEWSEGDVDALAEMIASDDSFGAGEVYEKLLVRRNADWTDQIEALMANEPGQFLIAVGAAHLAGPDSVQSMLEDRGFSVERQ